MTRSEVLQIRLSPEEMVLLDKVAERLGKVRSDVARRILLRALVETDVRSKGFTTRFRTRARIKEMREQMEEIQSRLEEMELREALED